jgi:hypothetical protein
MFRNLFKKMVTKEKVLIVTEDYEVTGWVYSAKHSKDRFLSNLLNGANKNFIAITDCEITYKHNQGEIEKVSFLQLNVRYIILIRPFIDETVI